MEEEGRRRLGRPRTAPTFILQSSSHPAASAGAGDKFGDGGKWASLTLVFCNVEVVVDGVILVVLDQHH